MVKSSSINMFRRSWPQSVFRSKKDEKLPAGCLFMPFFLASAPATFADAFVTAQRWGKDVKGNVVESGHTEEHFMIKQAQPKPSKSVGKKNRIVIHKGDGKITAFLTYADDVVERVATKALSGNALRQASVTVRTVRAPHLSMVERELSELKKVVEALAVRSVAQEHQAHSFDPEGMTVLDADVAYHLLENPPEPNEALRNLLALR